MIQSILDALDTDISYLVAMLLVLFYAWSRFNTPRTVRSETSRFQFYGSGVAYVICCEAMLLIITWLVKDNPDAINWLHMGAEGSVSKEVSGFDAPAIGALMLTTLLPSFPFLRDFDAGMLSFFHGMGAIPVNAIRWVQRLGSVSFVMTESALERARQYVRCRPDLQDDLALKLVIDPEGARIPHAFTEVVVLYVAYRDLEIQPRFVSAFHEIDVEFEAKMANFFAHSLGYFATIDQLSAQKLQPPADATENIRKVILASAADVKLMLARALLYSCNNDLAVANKFRAMGFAIPPAKRILIPANLLCLDLLGVIALFIVSTVLSANTMPIEKAFSIGVLVAFNHVIAAIAALVPKQAWKFADIEQSNERPWLAYFLSTLAALLVGLTASYAFYLYRIHFFDASGPVLPFSAQCKWLVLSTVLALALAFECDNFRNDVPPPLLRWAEGAGLGVLMGMVGAFVVYWLRVDQALLHANDKPPSLLVPILLSAAIGALFGSTIPHWYRTSVSRVTKPPRPDSLATPAAI